MGERGERLEGGGGGRHSSVSIIITLLGKMDQIRELTPRALKGWINPCFDF